MGRVDRNLYLLIVVALLAVEVERVFGRKARMFSVEVAVLDVAWSHVRHAATLGIQLASGERVENRS